MHELSLLADLLKKMESIRVHHNAARIIGVKVKLGALSHISADHFREHFEEAVRNTPAEGALLEVEMMTDETDPNAQQILLDSVEVVDQDP